MLKPPAKMAGLMMRTPSIVLAMVLLSMALSGKRVAANQHHVVEDDKGWDTSSHLAASASARLFKVADKIWFDNTATQESLVELKSVDAFSSCDLSNPIKMYNEAINQVSLDGEGSRYFVSGNPESCKKGLKLHINMHPINDAPTIIDGGSSPDNKDDANLPHHSSEDEDVPDVPEPPPSPTPKPKPPHKAPPPHVSPDSPPEPYYLPPDFPPPTPSSSTPLNGHFVTMVAATCFIAFQFPGF